MHESHLGLASREDEGALVRDDHDLPAAARVIGAGEHRERSLAFGVLAAALRGLAALSVSLSQASRTISASVILARI